MKKGHIIVPPWLYEIKDRFIVLHFGEEPMEIEITDNGLLSELKEQKPYIKMNKEKEGWQIDAPITVIEEEK